MKPAALHAAFMVVLLGFLNAFQLNAQAKITINTAAASLSAPAGGTASITLEVGNWGNQAADAELFVSISNNGSFYTALPLISLGSFQPYTTRSVSVNVPIPADIIPGAYRLGMAGRPNGSSLNLPLTVEPAVTPTVPDVSITLMGDSELGGCSGTPFPATLNPGNTLNIPIRLRGLNSIASTVRLGITLVGRTSLTVTPETAVVNGNSTVDVCLQAAIPQTLPPGSYQVKVTAFPFLPSTDDANYANNEVDKGTLTISAAPVIRIVSIQVPPSAKPGEPVVANVTIANEGGAVSGPIYLRHYQASSLNCGKSNFPYIQYASDDKQEVASLHPGEQRTVAFTFKASRHPKNFSEPQCYLFTYYSMYIGVEGISGPEFTHSGKPYLLPFDLTLDLPNTDLAISIEAADPPVFGDDGIMTYKVKLRNNGPEASLTNYVFLGRCDSSPYGCPAGTVSGGTLTSNPLNGSLLWVAPALPAGGEATADLTLQINNAILQLDSFRVGASLSSGAQSLNEDPVAGNNSAGVTFRRVNTGGTPNVIITQVTCPTDFPGPDQRMVWYVEFENTGTAPSQSRYIYLYNGVFYDGTKPNLLYGRAVVPSLLPGQKLSTAFFVQPSVYFPTPGDAGTGEKSIFTGKLYLSYSEDGATEDYGIDDGFPDLSCKTYTTDLALDILANASPIGPRDPLQFKMIIYNNGPEDAYNIWTPIYIDSYTPSFPAKQVNAAVTNGSVWNYAPNFGANGTIFTYWYIPVLRRGQTAEANATVSLYASHPSWPSTGVILARTVDMSYLVDPNRQNNTKQITIPVSTATNQADLELEVISNQEQAGKVVLTVQLRNRGPQSATDTRVQFNYLSGTNVLSVTAPSGSTYQSGLWAIPTLSAGQSKNIVITLEQAPQGVDFGFRAEVISASLQDPDSSPNNFSEDPPYEDDQVRVVLGGSGPGPSDPCEALTVSATSNSIVINGLTTPVRSVQVFDIRNGWRTVFSCLGNCAGPQLTIPNLAASEYVVKVDMYTAAWQPVCQKQVNITVGAPPVLQPELNISDFRLPVNMGNQGAIVNYSFDLNNTGDAATPEGTEFFIYAYLSTDQTLSSNDVKVGDVNTGFIKPGTVQDVPGAITVPANLAAGNYYLILKIDATAVITEKNENNNVSNALAFTVKAVQNSLPDLQIANIQSPSGPFNAGSSFQITFDLVNAGTLATPSGQSFDVSTYLSTDAVFSSNDVRVARLTTAGVPVGTQSGVAVQASIPAGTASGNYYLFVVADAGQVVSESLENNNQSAARTLTIGTGAALPDVTFAANCSIQRFVSPVVAGNRFEMWFCGQVIRADLIQDDPRLPNYHPVWVDIYLSADGILSSNDRKIGRTNLLIPTQEGLNESFGVTDEFWFAPVGTYQLLIQLDPENLIAESNETNNVKSLGTLQVISSGTTNLTNVAWSEIVSSAFPGDVVTGRVLYTISGTQMPGAYNLKYYLSTDADLSSNDVLLGSLATPEPNKVFWLGIRSNPNVEVPIPSGTTPGNYYLIAKLDADNAVAETNENDNTAVMPFEVKGTTPPPPPAGAPDFIINGAGAAISAAVGTNVSLTYTVGNFGTGDTGGPVDVRIQMVPNGVSASAKVLLTYQESALKLYELRNVTKTVTIPAGSTPGKYLIYFEIDYTQQYAEKNEGGNGNISFRGLTVTTSGASALQGTDALSPVLSTKVFPNPVESDFTLQLQSPQEGRAIIRLLDATGRMIWQKKETLVQGSNQWTYEAHDLHPGAYLLQVMDENGQMTVHRLVK